MKYEKMKLLLSLVIRSMGRTQMNEQSSRSHFVVTLRICGINEVHAFTIFLSQLNPIIYFLIHLFLF